MCDVEEQPSLRACSLVRIRAGQRDMAIPVPAEQSTILGRGHLLEGASVLISRRNIQINYYDALSIQDLGSTNGTRVYRRNGLHGWNLVWSHYNPEHVSEPFLLETGDAIIIGARNEFLQGRELIVNLGAERLEVRLDATRPAESTAMPNWINPEVRAIEPWQVEAEKPIGKEIARIPCEDGYLHVIKRPYPPASVINLITDLVASKDLCDGQPNPGKYNALPAGYEIHGGKLYLDKDLNQVVEFSKDFSFKHQRDDISVLETDELERAQAVAYELVRPVFERPPSLLPAQKTKFEIGRVVAIAESDCEDVQHCTILRFSGTKREALIQLCCPGIDVQSLPARNIDVNEVGKDGRLHGSKFDLVDIQLDDMKQNQVLYRDRAELAVVYVVSYQTDSDGFIVLTKPRRIAIRSDIVVIETNKLEQMVSIAARLQCERKALEDKRTFFRATIDQREPLAARRIIETFARQSSTFVQQLPKLDGKYGEEQLSAMESKLNDLVQRFMHSTDLGTEKTRRLLFAFEPLEKMRTDYFVRTQTGMRKLVYSTGSPAFLDARTGADVSESEVITVHNYPIDALSNPAQLLHDVYINIVCARNFEFAHELKSHGMNGSEVKNLVETSKAVRDVLTLEMRQCVHSVYDPFERESLPKANYEHVVAPLKTPSILPIQPLPKAKVARS